jgi:hypothetical protein
MGLFVFLIGISKLSVGDMASDLSLCSAVFIIAFTIESKKLFFLS